MLCRKPRHSAPSWMPYAGCCIAIRESSLMVSEPACSRSWSCGIFHTFNPPFFALLEEFVQAIQSTAGMAVVLLTRSMLGNGEQVAKVVSARDECGDALSHKS